jgi:hypothetical protein
MNKLLHYTTAMEEMAGRIPPQNKRMSKLYKDSLAEVKALSNKNKKKFGVKTARGRSESPTGVQSPKRQKIGGEAEMAAQGRSTETGEPSRQKRKPSSFEQ